MTNYSLQDQSPKKNTKKNTKDYTVAQLKEMAKKKKIPGYSKLRKNELLKILRLGNKKITGNKITGNKKITNKITDKDDYRCINKECPIINSQKYDKRPSPPRPANDPGCRGKIFRGNDGKWYGSKPNKNGVFRWVLLKE